MLFVRCGGGGTFGCCGIIFAFGRIRGGVFGSGIFGCLAFAFAFGLSNDALFVAGLAFGGVLGGAGRSFGFALRASKSRMQSIVDFVVAPARSLKYALLVGFARRLCCGRYDDPATGERADGRATDDAARASDDDARASKCASDDTARTSDDDALASTCASNNDARSAE